jgi:serine protease AprX
MAQRSGNVGVVMNHEHGHQQNRFAVLPTALRLGVESNLAGRGVTIAFLDSGFVAHPDLTHPVNRIIAHHDITGAQATLDRRKKPDTWDWHGTLTSTAAAGNGFLSDGVYRGLASEASVVLVKVSDRGKIAEPNIERGLRWVIANRERYNIRVVSISVGGDEDVPHETSAASRAAEDAVKAGIVVVVAAGNSGCAEHHNTVPPANAPSVITVGGYNDNNQLDGKLDLYCSSYGVTADGIVKPEIIAPAMWVAAPILPKTDAYTRAEALSRIAASPDYVLRAIARIDTHTTSAGLWEQAGLPDSLRVASIERVRAEVDRLLEENKIVATHYQHVDGTSFAAPVVSSLVAQMLEVNPRLTPAAVKHILISTANRIAGAPAIRQGYGVLNARGALEAAGREQHSSEAHFFCPPRVVDGHLEFAFHDDSALTVSLAGDFNRWDTRTHAFARDNSGVWRARIATPAAGRYGYKLVIDQHRWVEDPANIVKEPDGYGGFNSVLQVS